jgi:hypothetical protein
MPLTVAECRDGRIAREDEMKIVLEDEARSAAQPMPGSHRSR